MNRSEFKLRENRLLPLEDEPRPDGAGTFGLMLVCFASGVFWDQVVCWLFN